MADLPEAWNALSVELLGLHPKNDAEGVLQDVHWSGGAFGYFPSYCLGNMIAAQLWDTILEAMPDLETDFEQGDFSRLLAWLRENIHRQGQRYDTVTLVRRVTGEAISPEAPAQIPERPLPAAVYVLVRGLRIAERVSSGDLLFSETIYAFPHELTTSPVGRQPGCTLGGKGIDPAVDALEPTIDIVAEDGLGLWAATGRRADRGAAKGRFVQQQGDGEGIFPVGREQGVPRVPPVFPSTVRAACSRTRAWRVVRSRRGL